MNRDQVYAALVAERRACRRCSDLLNPAAVAGGIYDAPEIGPWTVWQGALDAELMVVGQDWGDTTCFEAGEGKDSASNPTNRNLRKLLAEAGFNIDEVGQVAGRGTIYLTNAILCLKSGGMGGAVQSKWFKECAPQFLRAQIEIVSPRVVVALGERAYGAVGYAFGFRPDRLRDAVESPAPRALLSEVLLMPVYHCSPRVLAGTRPWDKQRVDWQRVGDKLRELRAADPRDRHD